MSFAKPFNLKFNQYRKSTSTWGAPFPNPADFNFNYRKLLDSVPDGKGLAQNRIKDHTIAIVGGGIAGLTAARELLRCGYTKITIYEAGTEYGGRHTTFTTHPPSEAKQEVFKEFTPIENGAMRFPPFLTQPGGGIEDGASILSYYIKAFSLRGQGFPNPGSQYADTGIFFNNGWLDGTVLEQTTAIWAKTDTEPPNPELKRVYGKWQAFAHKIIDVVNQEYVQESWPEFWKHIVSNYWEKTFRDVVLDTAKTYDPTKPGDFGGAGMTQEESNIFYLIGGGDGSWGAFYNLSFLYAYRTFVHGFGSDLFLLQGRFDDQKQYNPGPYGWGPSIYDSLDQDMGSAASYLGSHSLDTCMLFMPIPTVTTASGKVYSNKSFYDFMKLSPSDPDIDIRYYSRTVITDIDEGPPIDNRLDTVYVAGKHLKDGSTFSQTVYSAILTVPTWLYGTDIKVGILDRDEGTRSTKWPDELQTYFSRAHWEPCCKIWVELKEAYWENAENKIPQVLTTDTFVHDMYAFYSDVGTAKQRPMLLISYTWWRDANKLQSIPDDEIIKVCLDELDRVLMTSANIRQKLSDHVVSDHVDLHATPNFQIKQKVWRWENKRYFRGAARLYDQREWCDTQLPMAYNQEYSSSSNIYFAGESYEVDAGWTEPAFRSAIDAVLHLAKNEAATFNVPDFDFARDYPQYDINWHPGDPII